MFFLMQTNMPPSTRSTMNPKVLCKHYSCWSWLLESYQACCVPMLHSAPLIWAPLGPLHITLMLLPASSCEKNKFRPKLLHLKTSSASTPHTSTRNCTSTHILLLLPHKQQKNVSFHKKEVLVWLGLICLSHAFC